jgi:hypothetical protein
MHAIPRRFALAFPHTTAYIKLMDDKPTAQQKALAAQQRKTEGGKALAEHRAREEAINRNTERLRALRLARDAEAPSEPGSARKRAAERNQKSKASLSDYLKRESDSGRKT